MEWEEHELGVIYKAHRSLPDGRDMLRILTWLAPNISVNPILREGPGGNLSIFVPVDDNHVRAINISRVGPGFTKPFADAGLGDLKPWSEMTFEEHQDSPNDYEAQVSQGPNGLPSHSQEHLVTSDKGIGIQRRVLRREINKVLNGEDPMNVAFEPGKEVIRVPSGNFFTQRVARNSSDSRLELSRRPGLCTAAGGFVSARPALSCRSGLVLDQRLSSPATDLASTLLLQAMSQRGAARWRRRHHADLNAFEIYRLTRSPSDRSAPDLLARGCRRGQGLQ